MDADSDNRADKEPSLEPRDIATSRSHRQGSESRDVRLRTTPARVSRPTWKMQRNELQDSESETHETGDILPERPVPTATGSGETVTVHRNVYQGGNASVTNSRVTRSGKGRLPTIEEGAERNGHNSEPSQAPNRDCAHQQTEPGQSQTSETAGAIMSDAESLKLVNTTPTSTRDKSPVPPADTSSKRASDEPNGAVESGEMHPGVSDETPGTIMSEAESLKLVNTTPTSTRDKSSVPPADTSSKRASDEPNGAVETVETGKMHPGGFGETPGLVLREARPMQPADITSTNSRDKSPVEPTGTSSKCTHDESTEPLGNKGTANDDVIHSGAPSSVYIANVVDPPLPPRFTRADPSRANLIESIGIAGSGGSSAGEGPSSSQPLIVVRPDPNLRQGFLASLQKRVDAVFNDWDAAMSPSVRPTPAVATGSTSPVAESVIEVATTPVSAQTRRSVAVFDGVELPRPRFRTESAARTSGEGFLAPNLKSPVAESVIEVATTPVSAQTRRSVAVFDGVELPRPRFRTESAARTSGEGFSAPDLKSRMPSLQTPALVTTGRQLVAWPRPHDNAPRLDLNAMTPGRTRRLRNRHGASQGSGDSPSDGGTGRRQTSLNGHGSELLMNSPGTPQNGFSLEEHMSPMSKDTGSPEEPGDMVFDQVSPDSSGEDSDEYKAEEHDGSDDDGDDELEQEVVDDDELLVPKSGHEKATFAPRTKKTETRETGKGKAKGRGASDGEVQLSGDEEQFERSSLARGTGKGKGKEHSGSNGESNGGEQSSGDEEPSQKRLQARGTGKGKGKERSRSDGETNSGEQSSGDEEPSKKRSQARGTGKGKGKEHSGSDGESDGESRGGDGERNGGDGERNGGDGERNGGEQSLRDEEPSKKRLQARGTGKEKGKEHSGSDGESNSGEQSSGDEEQSKKRSLAHGTRKGKGKERSGSDGESNSGEQSSGDEEPSQRRLQARGTGKRKGKGRKQSKKALAAGSTVKGKAKAQSESDRESSGSSDVENKSKRGRIPKKYLDEIASFAQQIDDFAAKMASLIGRPAGKVLRMLFKEDIVHQRAKSPWAAFSSWYSQTEPHNPEEETPEDFMARMQEAYREKIGQFKGEEKAEAARPYLEWSQKREEAYVSKLAREGKLGAEFDRAVKQAVKMVTTPVLEMNYEGISAPDLPPPSLVGDSVPGPNPGEDKREYLHRIFKLLVKRKCSLIGIEVNMKRFPWYMLLEFLLKQEARIVDVHPNFTLVFSKRGLAFKFRGNGVDDTITPMVTAFLPGNDGPKFQIELWTKGFKLNLFSEEKATPWEERADIPLITRWAHTKDRDDDIVMVGDREQVVLYTVKQTRLWERKTSDTTAHRKSRGRGKADQAAHTATSPDTDEVHGSDSSRGDEKNALPLEDDPSDVSDHSGVDDEELYFPDDGWQETNQDYLGMAFEEDEDDEYADERLEDPVDETRDREWTVEPQIRIEEGIEEPMDDNAFEARDREQSAERSAKPRTHVKHRRRDETKEVVSHRRRTSEASEKGHDDDTGSEGHGFQRKRKRVREKDPEDTPNSYKRRKETGERDEANTGGRYPSKQLDRVEKIKSSMNYGEGREKITSHYDHRTDVQQDASSRPIDLEDDVRVRGRAIMNDQVTDSKTMHYPRAGRVQSRPPPPRDENRRMQEVATVSPDSRVRPPQRSNVTVYQSGAVLHDAFGSGRRVRLPESDDEASQALRGTRSDERSAIREYHLSPEAGSPPSPANADPSILRKRAVIQQSEVRPRHQQTDRSAQLLESRREGEVSRGMSNISRGMGDGSRGTREGSRGTGDISHGERDGSLRSHGVSHGQGDGSLRTRDVTHGERDGSRRTVGVSHGKGDGSLRTRDVSHGERDVSHGESHGSRRTVGVSHGKGDGSLRTRDVSHGESHGSRRTVGVSHGKGDGSLRTRDVSHGESHGSRRTVGVSHLKGDGSRRTGDGSRRTGDGSRRTGDGSRRMGDGSRRTGDGSRRMGDGSRRTGDGSRRTGNVSGEMSDMSRRKSSRGTDDKSRGTGDGLTAVYKPRRRSPSPIAPPSYVPQNRNPPPTAGPSRHASALPVDDEPPSKPKPKPRPIAKGKKPAASVYDS
ncbi:hypothetical protein PUNSTDRAFT_126900 [Punctularia strigosozonata HHB-11173 SS5]|uniref:uncharacterized protein n=1 Tax=Punctularia strigosozonata (strain HHB-11173) TaxID=741275 RepID=UPI00044177CD|nr:uncharacterized protein PUNSTDRAFT_126900 [Punctularia strigosozonata HHB-11173 SS5]EIN06996.1 hypothetical protein PUNSTDRAFT_126900 [Punctularia strigosozonata HHB-11173 SS5]